MAAEEPLALRIHGLRLPPAIQEPIWPLSAEVSLAAIGLGIGLALALLFLRRLRQRSRVRAFESAVRAAARLPEEARWAAFAALVRRAALAGGAGSAAARLTGDDWLAWLDARTGGTLFRAGPGRVLGDALYRRSAEAGESPATAGGDLARGLPSALARLAGGRRAGLR